MMTDAIYNLNFIISSTGGYRPYCMLTSLLIKSERKLLFGLLLGTSPHFFRSYHREGYGTGAGSLTFSAKFSPPMMQHRATDRIVVVCPKEFLIHRTQMTLSSY